jgi:hypothetical protein
MIQCTCVMYVIHFYNIFSGKYSSFEYFIKCQMPTLYHTPTLHHTPTLYRTRTLYTFLFKYHSSLLRLIPYLHHTSSVLRWLPLELLSEIFNEGGIKIISLSNIRPIIIYFHSSQCRLIPYVHQRPIFFKTNSSIVAILELIRGAQCLIEVIQSSGEEM